MAATAAAARDQRVTVPRSRAKSTRREWSSVPSAETAVGVPRSRSVMASRRYVHRPTGVASIAGRPDTARVSEGRGLRGTFDRVAEAYDDARPRYPSELFDDLVALTGIRPGDPLLEMGCGSGIA